MKTEDILHSLEHSPTTFPEEALLAAIDNQTTITPLLLSLLNKVILDYREISRDYFGHSYALMLLAQFRCKEAFPIVLELCSLPDRYLSILLNPGEIKTEKLHKIIASTFDGDIEAIYSIIKNDNLGVWARDACIRSLLCLCREQKIERTGIIAFFKYLFNGGLNSTDGFILATTVTCACDLYAEELYEDIKEVFRTTKIDCSIVDLRWVKNIFGIKKEAILKKYFYNNKEYDCVCDAIQELQWLKEEITEEIDWSSILRPLEPVNTSSSNKQLNIAELAKNPMVSITYQRTNKKVGRNEVCSCGSNKKFKKCCLLNKESKTITENVY